MEREDYQGRRELLEKEGQKENKEILVSQGKRDHRVKEDHRV